ncbi:MAG: GNAT family N-acetyltransferase [Paucibacter sp.]|nr:GNAT family N-acetyltransferase [Roseateles sp.]
MNIRLATSDDLPAVLALNEESVHFLSPLSGARLARLHEQAALHQVLEDQGQVLAFLLAFREGAAYDSVNYQWFAGRYARFLYIDRVVVSRRLQTQGAGSALYRHAFAWAAAKEVPWVTCEFDVEPPNPVSERFHAKFGFAEVGRQLVAGGMKTVSLQAARVPEQGTN